ncbi:sugar ABC transporter ATP-binding protein [Microlunatus soli]|uniref:Ribose transport system ATP-binding protein n=1 Tax=Microlunatus soli TaxID=630515 RepID=A0A1H1PXD2_9ACTN|nr:sugar ABC transporter ATP-binding protein [Microlunatus soli]SDS15776.1 ribose transport system ATP-binding protein [Microlunatus soli]
MSEEAFALTGVCKSYPGVTALDDVTLTGYAGEVLAICGANGAGKSTLSRILAGQEQPTSGSVSVTGSDRPIRTPADAEAAGILLMHQEPMIIDDFTVLENIWLSRLSAAGTKLPWSLVPRIRRQDSIDALRAVGLQNVPGDRLGRDLGPGLRQMVALARTHVVPHRVLLLDETTASTTEDHFEDVLALVDRERRAGVSVVFVSHRMDEVFAMADRIAVLRNGQLIDVVATKQTTPDEVMTLMIGDAVEALQPPDPVPVDPEPILQVQGLSSGSAQDIDFEVRHGEVLGVYGLVGSGRSSIVRAISGNQSRRSGSVILDGTAVAPRSPRDGVRRRIAYLTEDRRREGFVADFSNGHNLTLATLDRVSRFGVIDKRRERRRAEEMITGLQVKGGVDDLTRSLSGGNQQKVIIGKWLETEPRLVLLDEPTKGIDVGARANIYRLVRQLAANGTGVVVVTSEAEEALHLCNRVLVLREGRIVDECISRESTTDDLIRASLGGTAA